MRRFVIPGKLPSENEFIAANRADPRKGNAFKQTYQRMVWAYIKQAQVAPVTKRVIIRYDFYEPNKKRDCGNIFAFASKVTEDALQDAGVLPNDNQTWLGGYDVKFDVDKENPRIEVELKEET